MLKHGPQFLKKLIDYHGGKVSKIFREGIRGYNSIFSFTSMGGHVDSAINTRRGPYYFLLHRQNYHLIGSLLPQPDCKPKFFQLYIYDTDNEIHNRVEAMISNKKLSSLDVKIIEGLLTMLNDNNALVRSFRFARDMLQTSNVPYLKLKLICKRQRDGRQYNLHSTFEVVALIVGEFDPDNKHHDIVIQHNSGVL